MADSASLPPSSGAAGAPHGGGRRPVARRVLRAVGHIALEFIKRGYAAALIIIILWVSWRAFQYLLISLVLTARPPPQIVDLPTLGPAALERGAREFAAAAATERPRIPPWHYHRFEAWFQPDRFNDCTRSGCHAPLPHSRRKESRAFLNMHATSVHCGVCHLQAESEPLQLVWYDLESGRASGPPAVLQAFRWLHDAKFSSTGVPTLRDQEQIVELLRAAASEAGDEPTLRGLAEHLAAVRVESAEFLRLLDTARETVPNHFRGEYGAKLALRDRATGRALLAHPGGESAALDYLRRGEQLGPSEREALLQRVHPSRRPQSLNCSDCHSRERPLVDLTSAGYPAQRIESLMRPMVMQAIEHIMRGEPLHLPRFIDRGTQGRAGPEDPGQRRRP
jgi:hypothetical protein